MAAVKFVHVPVTIAAFMSHVVTFGQLYSFGVFVPTFKQYFGISLESAAAINSTMIGLQFIGSLMAGVLMSRRVPHCTIAVISAVWVMIGYGIAASTETLELMYAGVAATGLGLGASNLAGLTSLNAQVKHRREFYVGFATCGTSIGTMTLPLLSTGLIDAYGWRWALGINGLIAGIVLLFTAPLFRVREAAAVKAKDIDAGSDNVVPTQVTIPDIGNGGASEASCIPCADSRFTCWFIHVFLCFSGFFAAPTLLAQFARDELDLSPSVIAMGYTTIGLVGLMVRALLGWITMLIGGVRRTHFLASVATGMCVTLMPWCWSIGSLVAWCALLGLSIGPLIPLISVILSKLFGTEVLPLYHGVSRLGVGLGSFLGPPLIAWLVEAMGYRFAFCVGGMLIMAGTICLVVLYFLHARKPATCARSAITENKTPEPAEIVRHGSGSRRPSLNSSTSAGRTQLALEALFETSSQGSESSSLEASI